MATILVTGATGFIGRPLCAALLARDYRVKASVRSAVKDHGWDDRIARFTADVENSHPDVWRKALDGVDTLIHLAARVHDPSPANDQPFRCVNTLGTARLCQLAVECGVRQFIYLSTIKINGETSPQPLTEIDPAHAQGAYALSKWQAEQRIRAITQGQDCQAIIIRPPLVYGPRVKANFLSLLKLISTGLPLPMGSFHHQRSMVYVGNLVDAIICAMENPKAAGQVFTISDGQDIAVVDLVRLLAKAMGKKPKLFPFPPSWLHRLFKIVGRGEMVDKLNRPLTVNASKFRETLGWRPPFSLSQGLADTVDWFRKCNHYR